MHAREDLKKPYSQSYRRVISASITLILALVLLSFLVTQMLFDHNKKLDTIRSDLNQQILIWGTIERVILFRINGRVDPTYAVDVLGKKMQEDVASNLEKSQILATQLDAEFTKLINSKMSLLLRSKLAQETLKSNVGAEILKGVKSFSTAPFELLLQGDQFWDMSDQISFRSGKYIDPLQNTMRLIEERRTEVRSISTLAIIALNILVVSGILLIWRLALTPAFDKMRREHIEKMAIISKLADRNADFEASFFALEHAAVIVGENGNLKYLNPLFYSLFGISSKSEIGGTIFDYLPDLDFDAQSPTTKNIQTINELIAFSEQGRIIVIDGRHYSISCSSVAQERWIVLFNDYEYFMRSKEVELNKKRLETLDYISAGVAHDFNNILGSILSRAEIMELNVNEKNNLMDALSDIKSIIESCERGKAVTSNLLSYARQKKLNTQSMSSSKFLEILQKQIILPKNVNLKIESKFDAFIDADIMQLITAVENLIKNAIDAMHMTKGEIRLIVNVDAEFPSLISIRVEDDGAGFSADAIEQASDPFFSTKSMTHGHGLGLSMVAGFISQSSGVMSYGNRKGGGAYVQISLPFESRLSDAVELPHSEKAKKAPVIGIQQSPKRCLIVEDNLEICDTLGVFFKPMFENIDIATTCEMATKLIQSDVVFDVAICDWTLPDGDSGNLIAMLQEKSPQVKIFVATGNVGKKLKALAQESKLAVLEKPFSLHDLRSTITESLHE